HGYCGAQNRVCLLVETHSLKPFENRVFSTKSMMMHTLEYVNSNHAELILVNLKAEKETIKKYALKKQPFPLILSGTEKSEPFRFKAFQWKDEQCITSEEPDITHFAGNKTFLFMDHLKRVDDSRFK
ncbi:MAG: hypothetical protein R6V76_03475, partial [Desulfobacterales bacterium]